MCSNFFQGILKEHPTHFMPYCILFIHWYGNQEYLRPVHLTCASKVSISPVKFHLWCADVYIHYLYSNKASAKHSLLSFTEFVCLFLCFSAPTHNGFNMHGRGCKSTWRNEWLLALAPCLNLLKFGVY